MKSVLAAMSGGVDSSAAAYLLRCEGYNVTGVMLKLYGNEDIGKDPLEPCHALASRGDAELAAAKLGISFEVRDLTREFRREVMGPFASEYMNGRTPNPCVVCNRTIKFGAMLGIADELGCDYLATGHYARVERENGRYLLKKGRDEKKDQSYALFSLTQDKLSRVLLPLGAMTKDEVREAARENGLIKEGRSESQDICFVPDGDYAGFLRRFTGITPEPGDIVGTDGQLLGRHEGLTGYTIGQRRGLGVSSAGRLFVKELDIVSNKVVLGDNQSLYGKRLTARHINLIAAERLDGDMRLAAKIRYGQREVLATVRQMGEDELEIIFDEPQRAITKGQYAVLYDGDTVIGGGVIAENN